MLSKTDETALDDLLPFRWDLMGFGLSHAWFTGLLAQTARVVLIPSMPLNYQIVMYIPAALTALALILLAPHASNRLQATRLFIIVSAVAMFCVGLITWGSARPFLMAGFIGVGACGAFFEITWAVRLATLPRSSMPLYILLAMALSSLINVIIGFLPEWGISALSMLLPLAPAVLWSVGTSVNREPPKEGNSPSDISIGPSIRSLTSVILGCLVFSFTYNLFVTLVYGLPSAEIASAVRFWAVRFWANLLAALMLLASFMLIRRVSAVGIFRFIMPITAMGFVLYLLAPQGLGEAALAIAGVGRKFFDILTLVLVLRVTQELDLSRYRWAGF